MKGKPGGGGQLAAMVMGAAEMGKEQAERGGAESREGPRVMDGSSRTIQWEGT